MRHPGEVVERRRLHEEVWGYTFDPGTNVADVFVGYLRRKLEAAASRASCRPCAASGSSCEAEPGAQPPWSPDAWGRARRGRGAAGGGRRRLALRRLLRARGPRRPPGAHGGALARHRAGRGQRRAPRQRQAPRRRALGDGQVAAPHAGREGAARHRGAAARAPAPASRAADLRVRRRGATGPTSPRCAIPASAASRAWRSSARWRRWSAASPSSTHRLLALGLLALLAAAAGAWLAADLVLRPLRRLRTVASSVAEDEDLDRRVPPGGPTELRSLAASFNAMLARLGRSAADRERALAATRRFTADAGHELRTPLTSVQATLSTLERHLDLPPDRRAAMLGDALDEQRRLVELLDGLQALARGDAGPLEFSEVDLAEVVDAAATRPPSNAIPACSSAPSCPIRRSRSTAGSPDCACWPTTSSRTPSRHGRAGRAGPCDARAARPGDDGGALLTVDDDGARHRRRGPRTDLRALRAPGRHQRRGLGLGLALVEQQVRHHGAQIDVGESSLGGARFSVRFAARSTPAGSCDGRARRPLQSDLPWGA